MSTPVPYNEEHLRLLERYAHWLVEAGRDEAALWAAQARYKESQQRLKEASHDLTTWCEQHTEPDGHGGYRLKAP